MKRCRERSCNSLSVDSRTIHAIHFVLKEQFDGERNNELKRKQEGDEQGRRDKDERSTEVRQRDGVGRRGGRRKTRNCSAILLQAARPPKAVARSSAHLSACCASLYSRSDNCCSVLHSMSPRTSSSRCATACTCLWLARACCTNPW